MLNKQLFMKEQRHMVKNQFDDRYLANRHLTDRHLANTVTTEMLAN
jgi:hypothetical protein